MSDFSKEWSVYEGVSVCVCVRVCVCEVYNFFVCLCSDMGNYLACPYILILS